MIKNIYTLTARHLILFKTCQEPICCMLDPCEVNHHQIPHIYAYVALEPDLAYMHLEHLRSHIKEGTSGCGPSLETQKERDQEDHSGFVDGGEGC